MPHRVDPSKCASILQQECGTAAARLRRRQRAFLALVLTAACSIQPAWAISYVGPNCQFHTVQAAINAAVPPEGILIAAGTYNELLHLNNKKRMVLQGGYTEGCATGASGPTVISGNGHAGDSVITVSGEADLDIVGVTISDGDENSDGGHGGGIDFGGHGTLTLGDMTLSNNFADYGGGLDVTPDGPTTVNIGSNTIISGNTAGIDGGGIHIDGPTRLFVLQPQTLIFQNHANRNGGGIDITGPARADIGSPGYTFFGTVGVIFDNTATNGAGISALAHDNDNEAAVVRLFTTDPDHPVTLQNNSATNVGGAVYLKPFTSITFDSANAALCAYDFRIVGNFAPEGAAIYADTDHDLAGDTDGDSFVFLNTDSSPIFQADDFKCNPESPPSLGAVPCATGVACNEISGNFTRNNVGAPGDGATVFLAAAAEMFANRFRLVGSSAGYAVHATASNTTDLNNCLVADNTLVHEVIRADTDSILTVNSCTLAHDTIGADHVISAESAGLIAHDDIIAEAGKSALRGSGFRDIQFVLSNEVDTLGGPTDSIVAGDPKFVNVGAGDYHLQPNSPALDVAPAVETTLPVIGNDFDLDGNPRAVDLAGIGSGVRDLGAYEVQHTDVIFASGFQ